MFSLRSNNTSMSRRGQLAKKLGCAKKAWKSFTNKLQSKLHKLNNIPRAIQSTTRRLRDLRSKFHCLIPSKLRALTKPSSTLARNQYYNHHYQAFESHIGYALGRSSYQYPNKVHQNKNTAAIHIDELFEEPAASVEAEKSQHLREQAETSKGKQVAVDGGGDGDGKAVTNQKKILYSVEDAWQAVVAKSPQLRVVDERAEEFIHKFRNDIKLQKEKSLLEFQEMLARGT